ncbi:MAG: dihydropteroate synthase [Syntrophomonadaceae bacterium]|nr:dihydropteroate synthase [Syntrophomonadaceae bacterium]
MSSGHHAVVIRNSEEAQGFLQEIGVDGGAYTYLLPKAIYRCIKLKQIPCRAANIIKQEMLSKGGEAAVKRDALSFEGNTDVLLMGNLKHYRLLLEKLRLQPFGLKRLATQIQSILDGMDGPACKLLMNGGQSLEIGARTLIMGILNVTPDSFSDGGKFMFKEQAVAHALQMQAQGADIIDIGGASSRPGAQLLPEDEEINRVLPVVEELLQHNLIISVDTFRAKVAALCLAAGAHIINDIGRLQLDPELLPVITAAQAPVVLMHNRLQFDQDKPYDDLISDIVSELQDSISQAVNAGVEESRIIIDPGIGFGKTPAQSRLLIKHLEEFKSLGRPILIGASRKSFIGQTLGLGVDERLEGSLGVTAMSIMNGADIIRVHDVRESKRVALMCDAVMHENG